MINQVAIIVTIAAIMTSILITFFPFPAHAQGTTKEPQRIQIPTEETSVPKSFCVDPARCNHHGNPAGLNTTSASNMTTGSNMTGPAGNTTGSNATIHGSAIPTAKPAGTGSEDMKKQMEQQMEQQTSSKACKDPKVCG